MGGGNWSKSFYDDQRTQQKAKGVDPFAYHQHSAATKARTGRHQMHASLDIFGPKVRESCDSAEHPHSRPIAVMIDQTGSMSSLPRIFLDHLGTLHGLLVKNGVADAQVLFGAIGDARNHEDVPLQVGQFESDNRMEEYLQNIVLEGNGGGQKRESYELAMYYFARHTKLDCWARGERGYLFILGDEMPWENVLPADVKDRIGETIGGAITTEAIVEELRGKYEVFFVAPQSISNYAGDQEVSSRWVALIGPEHVLKIERPEAIASVIATTVGLKEETVDLGGAVTNMQSAGVSAAMVRSVADAVDPLAKKTGALARVASGGLAPSAGRSGATVRL